MRLLLASLLLLSVLSLAAACPNSEYFVNGYWNLTVPSYSIPIDTSAACAASANSTFTFDNHGYYNQPGLIVGTNSTGSPACCPALPVGGAGPCCVGPQPVPAPVCTNFVCANRSSTRVGCNGVVDGCLVLARYDWVDYGSSTGWNGAAGVGVGLGVGAVMGSVVGWMLLLVVA